MGSNYIHLLVRCPKCDGRGFFYEHKDGTILGNTKSPSKYTAVDYVKKKCNTCGGAGMVRRPNPRKTNG